MTTGGTPSAGRLLERGTKDLAAAGIEEPRFQAELLLRHALGWTREHLLARMGDSVAAESLGHFFQLVERRRSRVPLQYLTGQQEFYGFDFHVTPAVLIPRPETEAIVEQASLALRDITDPSIIDVGTGSGCLAVALALTLPSARITAIDQSPAALAIARDNAVRHGVADRVETREGNLLDGIETREVHAVVSNPPYIADADFASLEPEVSDHEPREALSGGADGLDLIRRLVPQAFSVLRAGGSLFMELGIGQAEAVERIATEAGFVNIRIIADLQAIPRVMLAEKS